MYKTRQRKILRNGSIEVVVIEVPTTKRDEENIEVGNLLYLQHEKVHNFWVDIRDVSITL